MADLDDLLLEQYKNDIRKEIASSNKPISTSLGKRKRKSDSAGKTASGKSKSFSSVESLDGADSFDKGEMDFSDWLEENGNKSETIDLFSSLLEQMTKDLDPTASEARKAAWEPLPGKPQEKAFYSSAYEMYFGGAAGGGKLILENQNVLSPFGWKLVKNVRTGDTLVAADGTATKVLAVYPHKDIESYRVTFADGASVDVGDDHLWMFWYASKKVKAERKYILYSPEKGVHFEDVRGKLGLTSELYKYHKQQEEAEKRGMRPYWLIIPLCEPVRFTRPSKTINGDVIRIDPYFLGLLLGDGTITGNSGLQITTKDDEIVQWVTNHYGAERTRWDGNKQIHLNQGKELKENLTHYKLLGTNSFTKFIPESYLFASIETRTELMCGLMDTDGYVDSRGHMSYTSVSPQLAKNVQHLAWSLGLKATITSDIGKYRNDEGEIVECREAYTVYLQGADMGRFVKLSRKKERVKEFNGGSSEAGRRITSIEPIGKHDGACFAIDHPTGLHVVQDFIVTHNSDLMIGLASSEKSPHKNSIIFRTTFQELKWIVGRVLTIYEGKGVTFTAGQAMRFKGLPQRKQLELGYASNFQAAQKYKGRPHDLKLFDELPDFSENVYTFLIGWARTTEVNTPVRIVGAGNPPMTAAGEWVIKRWSPWLDATHPNPALPGELRWYANLDGEDKEIIGSNGEEFTHKTLAGETELIKPRSRTFVASRLTDNPYLMQSDYAATLQSMPEPYRSQLLYGSFEAAGKVDPYQLIPRAWVDISNAKWKELKDSGKIDEMVNETQNVSYGLDVASSGGDMSCLIRLVNNVVHYIEYFQIGDLMKQAQVVFDKISPHGAYIGVDANGIGLGLAQRLEQLGAKVLYIKGSYGSKARADDRLAGFSNLRSEMWWKTREALCPDSKVYKAGMGLIIPDHARLRGELVTPKYRRTGTTTDTVIYIESQDEIHKKIGRSPDGANALMYALRAARAAIAPRFV